MATYPNEQACVAGALPGANLVWIESGSPADDAGFYPGCRIVAINGEPLADILQWQWLSAEDEIVVRYVDGEGDEGEVELYRENGESWGFGFEGSIFDKVHQCRNACTFCFMRQLPEGLRPSLTLRDDDYRLSFIDGTFVTLTNLKDEDISRIISQRLSPLRLSLHAVNPEVRQALIGRHAGHGMACLEKLLDAGIEFCAQIVLVPGVNDGEVLRETLDWCYQRPGILEIGIVPLGFTRYQSAFDRSFDDPEDALALINLVQEYQSRAIAERGSAWVYAADEFYLNAYGSESIDKLPDSTFYGDFAMYEDGVGIARSFIDDFRACEQEGLVAECARALQETQMHAFLVIGEAPISYSSRLIEDSRLRGCVELLPVKNEFFGGNVDVTGLLCGSDIVACAKHVREVFYQSEAGKCGSFALVCIPSIVFNDDGLTLDGYTLQDMESESGVHFAVISNTASGFIPELVQAAHDRRCSW